MEFVSYHIFDAYNFEVASRLLENMYTLVLVEWYN
jgi:hypothetical protein